MGKGCPRPYKSIKSTRVINDVIRPMWKLEEILLMQKENCK